MLQINEFKSHLLVSRLRPLPLLAVLGALVLLYNHFLGMGQLMKGLG